LGDVGAGGTGADRALAVNQIIKLRRTTNRRIAGIEIIVILLGSPS
jgi:hypothetical protein